jgi:hypothetical protein
MTFRNFCAIFPSGIIDRRHASNREDAQPENEIGYQIARGLRSGKREGGGGPLFDDIRLCLMDLERWRGTWSAWCRSVWCWCRYAAAAGKAGSLASLADAMAFHDAL